MSNKSIQAIQLDSGETIYVEVEDLNNPLPENVINDQFNSGMPADLPRGVENAGLFEDAIVGSKLLHESLRDTISGTAKTILSGFHDTQPDEWSVEINIALRGKAKIIPVLVSGEGEGSIKVTATWRKE